MKFPHILNGEVKFNVDHIDLAWWLVIYTQEPPCTYYFGPFLSASEALLHKNGYVKDLVMEEAQGFSFVITEQLEPDRLTIEEDDLREQVFRLAGKNHHNIYCSDDLEVI